MKNYIIEYQDWDSYNVKSREEAIKLFRKDHGEDVIKQYESDECDCICPEPEQEKSEDKETEKGAEDGNR